MNRRHDDDYDDEDTMLNDSISELDPDGLSLADDDEMRSAHRRISPRTAATR